MAGPATSGVRSAAVPERTARARSAEPRPAPRTALQAAPAPEGPATTRDRLAASFAAPPALEVAAPAAPEPAASAPVPSSPAAAPAPAAGPSIRERIATEAGTPVLEPAPTTRARVATQVRPAIPEPEKAPMAEVIDLAAERERRRPPAEPAAPAAPEPEKPVVAPLVEPVARGPPPPAPAQAAPATPAAAEPTAAPKPAEPEAVAETPAAEQEAPAAEPGAAEPAPITAAPGAAAPAAAIAAPETEAAPAEAETPAVEAEPAEPEAAPEEEPAAEAEAAAEPPGPEAEPGFQAMMARTQQVATERKEHQPATEGVATTQAAAPAPANDLETQAQTAKVEVMGEQEPKEFDKAAFVAAVKKAIEAATPKTLEDVDDFKESGAVAQATQEVNGLVKGGKAASEKDIATATAAPLDTSTAVEKPAAEMVNDEPGEAATDVGAAGAMPTPRPAEEFDFSDGPAKVDTEMAQANVTDEQLAKSNEPDFTAAVASRDKAREHAATAAPTLRTDEELILAQGRETASADAAAQLQSMQGARAGKLESVLGDKDELKTRHETEHARITSEIQAIYTATESDVRELLDGLDEKVETAFTSGEEAARTAFEDYVDKRMRDYKDDRYDRIGGSLLWLKDKIAGMPDEVDAFYVEGRDGYIRDMDAVIEGIATIVGTDLTAARARIVQGRAEVRTYVEALPENLKTIGTEAEEKLTTQFEQLGQEVDSKQDAVVDMVAQRYVEARGALDERIEELKKANQGLVAAALDAVVGVIKTILALGEMLLRILAKAAEVVGDIISDPIGFLDNLVSAVMGGLTRFVNRIGEHLQNALVEWLFGTMGKAGITPPDALDGPGILHLVTQVIGLTYDAIRARVVRVVGEETVARMEEGVELFKTLMTEGVGGLWELVSAKIGDLEGMVIGKIKDWVIERVIKGGIAWIIGLLNPVAAFIKACKAIYEIVMFIAERAKQIAEFVESVLDSISAIAKGDLGAAEEKVESSLAKALPLAIGFLASLLGIGGIAEKVKAIVAAVRRPIEKAVDTVVLAVAKAYKRTIGRVVVWAGEKVQAGKDWAKGKMEAGKEKLLGKAAPDTDAADDQTAEANALEQMPVRFGREAHELRGEVKDGKPRLIMASFDPDVIPARIAELRTTYVAPFAAAGGPMQARALALETDLSGVEQLADTRIAAVVAAPEERQLPLLHEALVTLRNRLEEVAEAHDLPGTGWVTAQHQWAAKGVVSHRRERGVTAQLCIFSWRNGAPAEGNPPGRRLAGFDGARYERGHLLARALGGEGDDPNLAMISKAANTEMRDYGEKTARENLDARPSVSGEHYSPENVLSYDVTVLYNSSQDLEKYLAVLGVNPSVAFYALFSHAENNGPVDQATVSGLVGRTLTPKEYTQLCTLWRTRFLAHTLEIRMRVLQGKALVGGYYGPIAAHR